MSRPDYVVCISDNHASNEGKSWCGRNATMEFTFTGIDHAAMNGRNEGRFVACKECTDAVNKALANGQVKP